MNWFQKVFWSIGAKKRERRVEAGKRVFIDVLRDFEIKFGFSDNSSDCSLQPGELLWDEDIMDRFLSCAKLVAPRYPAEWEPPLVQDHQAKKRRQWMAFKTAN